MKIEQLFVQYLYISKKVTLQGIGTFTMDPAVVLTAENEKEKDFVMPENAFQFEYNLKAGEDEGLVKYIVEHTSKILPLASADLDSYAMLAKQFLNIGKPLVIEGVGTVQKSQEGNYQFIPGHFITPKIDDYPKQLREKRDESVSFESEAKVNNSRRNLLIIIVGLAIVLSGLGIYYWLNNNKGVEPQSPEPEAEKVITPNSDTTVKITIDSARSIAPPVIKTDSNSFKIVLKNYGDSIAAAKAFKRLSYYGHKLEVIKVDALKWELAMPFKSSLSDTLRAKDSLRRFFGGNPYIKL